MTTYNCKENILETAAAKVGMDEKTARERPPLSQLDDMKTEITMLLAKRLPIYLSVADLTVRTDKLSAEQAALTIAKWLRTQRDMRNT